MNLIDNDDIIDLIKWNPASGAVLGQLMDDIFLPEVQEFVVKHRTLSQFKAMMVDANEMTMVMPRGTGKTEKIHAHRSHKCSTRMPGARGGFVGNSYLKLFENILPGLVKGWKDLGWKRGVDFSIKERFPKSMGVPEPYGETLDSSHAIFMRNGSAIQLISQDRKGSANSMTLHWVQGDEKKLLDKNMIDTELRQANRGDMHLDFAHLPEFHSWLWTTDMPTDQDTMWVLEEEKVAHPDRVQLLLDIQYEKYELIQKLLIAHESRRKGILQKIASLDQYWDAIRKYTFCYHEPKGHDNMEGFGIKQILDLKRTLPSFVFRTSILNERPYLTDNAFYPDLRDKLHCYDATDFKYVDDNIDRILNQEGFLLDDCRKDADYNPHLPLCGGFDYGAIISTLTLGQAKHFDLPVINSMYVKHPQRLKDLLAKFVDYYRFAKCKVFYYFYDHTAIATNASSDISYADEVVNFLEANGWKVHKCYMGHTPSFDKRYEAWGVALKGGSDKVFNVSFNRTNCEYLLTAMRLTQIKQGTKTYQKDKRNETKLKIDQRETTHFTDAVDTLLLGANKFLLTDKMIGFDVAF
ncbi:hypothetical protein [Runella sp.]|uniref:hypothetical protein n=1 Tax=Runella sp. TaxID=1960881 RepID=UPI003D142173